MTYNLYGKLLYRAEKKNEGLYEYNENGKCHICSNIGGTLFFMSVPFSLTIEMYWCPTCLDEVQKEKMLYGQGVQK